MTVERFKPEDLDAINLQPSQAMLRDAVTPDYLETVQTGPAITIRSQGEIIACGGVVQVEDGSVLWAFVAATAGRNMVSIVRAAQRMVEVARKPVYSTAACDFEPGCRLLRMLGFTPRPDPVDDVSADGKLHYLFVRTA